MQQGEFDTIQIKWEIAVQLIESGWLIGIVLCDRMLFISIYSYISGCWEELMVNCSEVKMGTGQSVSHPILVIILYPVTNKPCN